MSNAPTEARESWPIPMCGGGRNGGGVDFPAVALLAQGSKYWIFVLGFALGGYSTGLTKYATILSAALAVLQEVLQEHCIFFQLGIAAGVFIKLTRL